MNWKTLVILAILATGLVIWDRALSTQQDEARRQSARIASMLSPDALEDRSVAAIRVDIGEDDIFLYVRQGGLWRCMTAHGAIADNATIESLLPAMLEAEGVVRSTDPADAANFGFDGPEAITIAISGSDVYTDPGGDVIFSIDLGRSIVATGGSYVRPTGTDEIWAIDRDFRRLLGGGTAADVPGAPPMIDPHIIPQAWPGLRLGPSRLVIEQADQPPLVIQRRERDEPDARGLRFEWVVDDGESQYIGDTLQVTAYAVFLGRAQYAGVLAPRDAAELGLDQPRARITYETAEGPQLQLIVGGRGPRGGVVVLNTFSQLLLELDPQIAALLLPEGDHLLSDEHGNPWEPWMRR